MLTPHIREQIARFVRLLVVTFVSSLGPLVVGAVVAALETSWRQIKPALAPAPVTAAVPLPDVAAAVAPLTATAPVAPVLGEEAQAAGDVAQVVPDAVQAVAKAAQAVVPVLGQVAP